MASLKELLALAKSQVGYQEKASNACLDDLHENAGYRNHTKYSRDVDNWGLEGNAFDASCREAAGAALTSYGSSGTLTAIAEGILASKGFYSGNIDAEFGSGMEKAVREFQREQKLEPDGVIGRDTWTRLFS